MLNFIKFNANVSGVKIIVKVVQCFWGPPNISRCKLYSSKPGNSCLMMLLKWSSLQPLLSVLECFFTANANRMLAIQEKALSQLGFNTFNKRSAFTIVIDFTKRSVINELAAA